MLKRAHNVGGKGNSHVATASSHNRPFSLGLKAQQPGFKLKQKARRRH